DHRLRGRLPRSHHGRALADQLEDPPTGGLRSPAAHGRARSVPARPLLARALGRRRQRGARGAAPRHPGPDHGPQRRAAIVVEPIQGEGGYFPAPAAFLAGLREICDEHGILLIADEIQSGMGRTGRWWAMQHAGVEPDIVTVAKGIASGMPIGAFLARGSVWTWQPGAHGSTFGGNPVCAAAGLATLALLED